MHIHFYWSALFILLTPDALLAQALTPRLVTAVLPPDSTPSKSFRIICYNTLKPGNEPLYVVDGRPISAEQFKLLNPAEIQRISVLQRAQATTLYGSSANNGAILVTLKQSDGVRTKKQKRPVN
ncbi:TonB-dependent receptor plug domain-containing protein [Hymenobacter psychrophilus]|uniref:TonB-dependent receptor plug domain-containing protein n=1 Tax=Hymenobacter psychrophilus TaxID=651662 RepID=UPI000B861C71|nr:TonB-dependent receptor plug domain-containing protein [Hymenobacter psychrophilus]